MTRCYRSLCFALESWSFPSPSKRQELNAGCLFLDTDCCCILKEPDGGSGHSLQEEALSSRFSGHWDPALLCDKFLSLATKLDLWERLRGQVMMVIVVVLVAERTGQG